MYLIPHTFEPSLFQTLYFRTADGRIVPAAPGTTIYAAAPTTPTEDPSPPNKPPAMSEWKRTLSTHGYASCANSQCRLSFLSIAGIVAHSKTCMGIARPGDYVEFKRTTGI